VDPASTKVVIMMRRDAHATKTAISKRTCEVDKTLLQRFAVILAFTPRSA
jgi:hypothetical protein